MQVRVATQRARFELTGTPRPAGETWIVVARTASPRSRLRRSGSSDTLADVAAGARDQHRPARRASTPRADRLPRPSIDADGDGFVVTHASDRFYAVADHARQARHAQRRRRADGEATVELGGFPAMGEVWTLTVDGVATKYDGRLPRRPRPSIALASSAPQAAWPRSYDVTVVGRVITVRRDDGATPVRARSAIAPTASTASAGGAAVTAQLVFTPPTGTSRRPWTCAAVDDEFVDGGDALVFPALRGARQPRSAARSSIDGGVRVGGEPFLNNPLLLPGETNKPIPDGTVGTVGTTGHRRRRRSPTSTRRT